MLLSLSLATLGFSAQHPSFDAFLAKYHKQYAGAEYSERRAAYEAAVATIEAHNAASPSWTMKASDTMITLGNASAVKNSIQLQQPRLLLVYHIGKTGGSSLMAWFKKGLTRPAANRPVDVVVGYRLASRFMTAHFCNHLTANYSANCSSAEFAWRKAKPLDHVRSSNDFKMDQTTSLFAWQTMRIGVEFHTPQPREFFMTSVLPRMGRMRALYRVHQGEALAVTVVRDPLDHIFSVYRMWPPVVNNTLQPFPSYLSPKRAGLIVGCLTQPVQTRDMSRGNPLGCQNASLANAIANLRNFDMVGVTENLDAFGRTLTPGALAMPHVKPKSVALRFRREANQWTLKRLNLSTRQRVFETMRCDAALYTHVLQHTVY